MLSLPLSTLPLASNTATVFALPEPNEPFGVFALDYDPETGESTKTCTGDIGCTDGEW